MKVGDLVRYTPEGRLDDRWADWYGLVVKGIPGFDSHMVVSWNNHAGDTLSIRKKDLTVVNESR